MDDFDRENEADLIIAAETLTVETMARMIRDGPVETQMMQKIPIERQKRLKEATLNQQFCQAQEIADMAFWLADAAPNCLSGEVFDLNNGVNYR
jgi:3,4-dihydroxy-2-butanone 4-phosphate synthase